MSPGQSATRTDRHPPLTGGDDVPDPGDPDIRLPSGSAVLDKSGAPVTPEVPYPPGVVRPEVPDLPGAADGQRE